MPYFQVLNFYHMGAPPSWQIAVLQLVGAIAWPITILILAWSFRGLIARIMARVSSLKATPTSIELILEKMEREGQISSPGRAELTRLESYDIWALDTFAKSPVGIQQLNPAQRVAARTLIDRGLLSVADQKLVVTGLGMRLLNAATAISL